MYARNLDPELERLRLETLEHVNIETVVSTTHEAASRIHAAYLFENEGKQILQKLCLLLSATASGKSYGDWQKFAASIGIAYEQIQCIEFDFKGLQDPTYYVLLTFVQSVEATIDKIFLALQKIKRLDIINRVADNFNVFFQYISQNKSADLRSGLYKPNSLPRAPLVLSKIVKKQHAEYQNHTIVVYNPEKQNIANKMKNRKYGRIAMLTFTKDGCKTAEEIAKIFRSQDPKIGVVILQEQEKHVYCRAEEFVEDCFQQVNYIVPILTEGYLSQINGLTCDKNENNNLDTKYARYIFVLSRYEYVKQDCVNNRVRCIIPDNQVKNVLSWGLHPTLQAWFRESDLDLFTKRIILQKL